MSRQCLHERHVAMWGRACHQEHGENSSMFSKIPEIFLWNLLKVLGRNDRFIP